MNAIEARYLAVNERIKQASLAANKTVMPRLLAVSKKQTAENISVMFNLGQVDFGENYLQEGLDKINQLKSTPITWHFIGPIQSNKTKLIAAHFAWVQSVDRMKVLIKLNDYRADDLAPLNVLLQYKVGNEDSKSGASRTEIFQLAEAMGAMKKLKLRGLMCIPPPSEDSKQQLDYFNEAHQLYDELSVKYPDIDTLSMGMSGDLEAAITAGSTLLRIGTDLFGARTA